MKKRFIFVLLLVNILLYGCQSAVPSQSTFKANFSLNTVVEANGQYLLEETRALSGSEVGSSEPFTQSNEIMTLRIDPESTPAFMEAMRAGIEQELIANDARIHGTETGGSEHFSFSYIEKGLHGTIHVWGIPGENANFKMIVLITEG